MQTLNILEGAALAFCPSQNSLFIEGKYFPHVETKKLNTAIGVRGKKLTTVNTIIFFNALQEFRRPELCDAILE